MSERGRIGGATKVFAVVGDPVAHSLSPMIHNRWIAEAGLDAVYVALHLRSADAASDLRALARAGFSGLNVTLPHKIAALAAADDASDEARRVGAANTLILEDGAWRAGNTDVEGFALAVSRAARGLGLKGARVVLIGAGGAARAALAHLARAGADIAVANRSVANAQRMADELAPSARCVGLEQLAAVAADADLVINSASLGHMMSPGHADAKPPELPAGKGRAFLDMSYGKAAQAMLASADAAGWKAQDGLAMLVGQAAAAFRLWHGVDPDIEGALAACRARIAA